VRILSKLSCCLAVLGGAHTPVFVEAQLPEFQLQHSPTAAKFLLETMGGGVAMLDYNNDGRLDLFFVNGGHLSHPTASPTGFRRREPRYWNRLFRQKPDGAFEDVTQAAGLANSPDFYGMGVAVGDFDNDGHADLFVTGYPRAVLYRNNGDGTFADITAAAGIAAPGWSASAGFFDFDRDGHLDLFVTRYLDWSLDRHISCGEPFPAYCQPTRFPPVSNLLFRNEGKGRFRDVSAATGISQSKGRALGVAFGDYDDDGFPDIIVANDGMEQFLFHNEGGRGFQEVAAEAGVAFADDGRSFAGMGVAFADYDRDGRLDILITNLALEKYALFRNHGAGEFRYASLTSGLAALTGRSSGWGVALEDFNNDGWRDIFVAQGHVLDNVEKIHSGLRYLEPPALLAGEAGRFRNVPLALPPIPGRGLAVGDLNNDGALDVVITALGRSPFLLRNRSAPGHWLTVHLRGRTSNRDGAGALVRLAGQLGQASRAGSYLSASDPRVHFGLGPTTPPLVDLEVLWPSGKRHIVSQIAIDQIVTVEEPE